MGFLFDKLSLGFRMTRDLIFIMNYHYIPGESDINQDFSLLPKSVLKHESCDVDFEYLDKLVMDLIDEDIPLSLLVAQVRGFYLYGSDVRSINLHHIENCLIVHLFDHLKPEGLSGVSARAVACIKEFLQKLSDEPVVVEDSRVMVPGLIDITVDISIDSKTGYASKVLRPVYL